MWDRIQKDNHFVYKCVLLFYEKRLFSYWLFQGGASFVDLFVLFEFRVFLCHTVLSVLCSIVVTC